MRGSAVRLGVAAAIAISANAEARFAPLEGQTYRETVTQVHDDGSGAERFTIERTLVFARDGAGWIATVTFGPAQQSAKPGTSAMFARAMAALAGKVIRYRLNADGTIDRIEDEAFQWQRFVATVAAMGGPDEAHLQETAAIASALATLPVEQRRDMLTEPIAKLLASAEADRGAQATTPMMIAARSSSGVAAEIPGTISATEDTTTVRIVTEGEGPLGIGAQQGRVRIMRRREIDKATGLLREAREETVTDLVIDGKMARQSVTTTTSLTLVVS